MQCSRGGAYVLGMLQLCLAGLAIILFPPASTQIFVYLPCVFNGTLTHSCGDTKVMKLSLTLPTLIISASAAAFVSNTLSLQEAGLIVDENSFGVESLGQTGLWNALFWFVVSAAHAVAVAAACSPVDVFAWLLATHLCVSFLSKLCSSQESTPDGPVSSTASIANANILGYMAGAGIAFYNVPSDYSNRFLIILLMIILDYFLGVGHAWERCPSMETVANCRIFWACSAGLCSAALYIAWWDDLLKAPMGTDLQ